MFKTKRPPHCENLTDAQVKLVRRICKAEYYHDFLPRVEKALNSGWYDVLVAVLRQVYLSRGTDCGRAEVFEAVITERNTAALQVIAPFFNALGNKVEPLSRVLAQSDWQEGRDILLTQAESPLLRAQAMAEVLKSHTIDDKRAQILLALVQEPLDLHYDSGALMKKALRQGRTDIADALLAKGFDIKVYGAEIEESTRGQLPYAALVYLQETLRRHGVFTAAAAVVADIPPPVVENGFAAPTPDSITRIEALPNGGSLSIVFNFALRQQIVVAATPGPSTGVTVIPFAALVDDHAVKLAAAAFVAGGGDAQWVEGLVAPRTGLTIAKSALTSR